MFFLHVFLIGGGGFELSTYTNRYNNSKWAFVAFFFQFFLLLLLLSSYYSSFTYWISATLQRSSAGVRPSRSPRTATRPWGAQGTWWRRGGCCCCCCWRRQLLLLLRCGAVAGTRFARTRRRRRRWRRRAREAWAGRGRCTARAGGRASSAPPQRPCGSRRAACVAPQSRLGGTRSGRLRRSPLVRQSCGGFCEKRGGGGCFIFLERHARVSRCVTQ